MNDSEQVGRTSGPSRFGPTVLVAVVVGLVAVLALLAPVVLAGQSPSLVQLTLLPIIALVVGVVIRRQPGLVNHVVGTVVIGIAVLGALALGLLLWALVNGLGRPY
jgi:hypothetical protein